MSLSNVLAAAGYEVSREYYVNDAGRQMDILALSTWLRYLEWHDAELAFPQCLSGRLCARHGKADHGGARRPLLPNPPP